MYWLAVLILVVLDAAALIAVVALALKIRAFKIPTFFRGALGAVAAIPLELVRIFAGLGVTRWLGVTQGDDLLLLLLNMRMFNIPFLIGAGFLGGAFAELGPPTASKPATHEESGERVPCKKCGRQIPKEIAERQGGLCHRCQQRTAAAGGQA